MRDNFLAGRFPTECCAKQVLTEVSLPAGITGWSVPVQKVGATDPSTSLQPGMMLGERTRRAITSSTGWWHSK
jgi:hypothetical protein